METILYNHPNPNIWIRNPKLIDMKTQQSEMEQFEKVYL